jgi:hypothetical protein
MKKTFEDFTTVHLSDLMESGRSFSNWSASYHLNKSKGKTPYIKGANGMLEEANSRKSVPKDALYLTHEQLEKYNQITQEINKLKEEQNLLFAERDNIIK